MRTTTVDVQVWKWVSKVGGGSGCPSLEAQVWRREQRTVGVQDWKRAVGVQFWMRSCGCLRHAEVHQNRCGARYAPPSSCRVPPIYLCLQKWGAKVLRPWWYRCHLSTRSARADRRSDGLATALNQAIGLRELAHVLSVGSGHMSLPRQLGQALFLCSSGPDNVVGARWSGCAHRSTWRVGSSSTAQAVTFGGVRAVGCCNVVDRRWDTVSEERIWQQD